MELWQIRTSLLAVALAVVECLVGCSTGNEAKAVNHLSGSITVAQESDWEKLRIGVFFEGTIDELLIYYIRPREETVTGNYIHRMILAISGGSYGLMWSFPRHEYGSASFSITSGVHGTFRVELPGLASAPGNYHVVAWLEKYGNNELDLINSADMSEQIASSEFSRCPRYDGGGFYAGTFRLRESVYLVSGVYDGDTEIVTLVDAIAQDFSFDMTPVDASPWVGW
jgi:hypothetical protein